MIYALLTMPLAMPLEKMAKGDAGVLDCTGSDEGHPACTRLMQTGSLPSQCTSYSSISTSGAGLMCDNSISAGWYRPDNGLDLSTTAPDKNTCNTHAPGWVNFAFPTSSGQTTSGQACFHWSSNTCMWKTDNVQITHCGEYFVYYLVAPNVCHLKYCFNTHSSLVPGAPDDGISVHGDPMFQHNGKGQHFWLKEGVLSPLLDWTSDDGHKMSMQGLTVANAETGHQWFKQIALVRDGKQVLSSEVVGADKPTLALSYLDNKTVITDTFVKGNGDDAKDVTRVALGGMTFELSAESAHKFADAAQQAKYAHVNVKMPKGLVASATGLFAELAGAQPMSGATKALLRSPK